jgi:hypothetical protein
VQWQNTLGRSTRYGNGKLLQFLALQQLDMQGAILFFLILFAVFFAYKAFPTVGLHIYTKAEPTPEVEAETASEEEEAFANPIPCPQASEPPGSLPTATYGGMPDTIPRPAMDPTLEPTTRARIMQTLDDLRGFLNFEGDQLEEKSDPNIQLPLSTLKGDTQVLTNEAMVLQRNPGLRPTITGRQIAEIEANLDYLRQAWRRFAGVGAVESKGSKKEGFVGSIEGFAAGDPEVFYIRGPAVTKEQMIKALQGTAYTLATDANLLPQTTFAPVGDTVTGIGGWNGMNTPSTSIPLADKNIFSSTEQPGTTVTTLPGAYLYGVKPTPTLTASSGVKTGTLTLNILPASGTGSSTSTQFSIYSYNLSYYSFNDIPQAQGSSSSSFTSTAADIPPAPVGSSSSSFVARASTPAPVGTSSSSFSGSYTVTTADRKATKAELEEFKAKLFGELTRLINTGATDDITKGRIAWTEKTYAYITDLLYNIDTKKIKIEDVTIMKSSIDSAFKALTTTSDSLPTVMQQSTIPSWLNNLLSGGNAEDPETKQQIMDALSSYTNNFANNFSWSIDLGLDYTSPAKEKAMASYYNSRGAEGRGNSAAVNSGLNLNYSSNGAGVTPDGSAAETVTDEYGRQPGERCAGDAARFDWKKRSREICSAIKARGLNPTDYGCMPDGVIVSPDFSYKGYAKMVCHRVSANYDPGFGYLVGCPPQDWQGWR